MTEFTPQEKMMDLEWHIDNGFIYHKKCFSIFGDHFLSLYNQYKNVDETYPNNVINDHLLVRLAISYCKANNVLTLSQVLQNPQQGDLFCSIEQFKGNKDVYNLDRVTNHIILPFTYNRKVYTEFSTKYFTCDTGRVEQSGEYRFAIIGRIYSVTTTDIVIHPLIMGAPTFDSPFNNNQIAPIRLLFQASSWFEIIPEEIDNFSKMKEINPTTQEWQNYMKEKSEDDIKKRLCDILEDIPQKDWGGETNDHFTTSISIGGIRLSAAFLLKGPGNNKFKKMIPTFLGKNGDQINRLSKTPAKMLIVQHCHEIGEAVRETLQAFAVAPHIQKRYCLIDGKDTYKILKAYNKL